MGSTRIGRERELVMPDTNFPSWKGRFVIWWKPSSRGSRIGPYDLGTFNDGEAELRDRTFKMRLAWFK